MFLCLTDYSTGENIWINFNYVTNFYGVERNGETYTVLQMVHGSKIVKEKPDSIFFWLKA